MIKIKDMECGQDNIEFVAMINHVVCGKTNGANKTNYLSIVFQDDSGQIDAKLWNATQENIDAMKVGAVVRGKGDIIKYSDNRQMKIVSIDTIDYQESQQVEFLTQAPLTKDSMLKDLESYIKKITNMKLYMITKQLFEDHMEKFMIYPAASKNHHEYVSGLAYHTLSMLKLAESIISLYPELDSNLIYSGILLHDLGKTVELSGPAVPSYTVEGNLLGHISIAQAMIKEMADSLNIEGEEVTLLQHMVLSHHGKHEFGSPVLPQIREAEVISFIDNLDARINMFDKTLDTLEPGEFSRRVFSLDNRMIYKPKIYEK